MSSPKHLRDADGNNAPCEKRRKQKPEDPTPAAAPLQEVKMEIVENDDGLLVITLPGTETIWEAETQEVFQLLSQSTFTFNFQGDLSLISPCKVKHSKLVVVTHDEAFGDYAFRLYCFPNSIFQEKWLEDLELLSQVVYGHHVEEDPELAAQHAIWEAHRTSRQGSYTVEEDVTAYFVPVRY